MAQFWTKNTFDNNCMHARPAYRHNHNNNSLNSLRFVSGGTVIVRPQSQGFWRDSSALRWSEDPDYEHYNSEGSLNLDALSSDIFGPEEGSNKGYYDDNYIKRCLRYPTPSDNIAGLIGTPNSIKVCGYSEGQQYGSYERTSHKYDNKDGDGDQDNKKKVINGFKSFKSWMFKSKKSTKKKDIFSSSSDILSVKDINQGKHLDNNSFEFKIKHNGEKSPESDKIYGSYKSFSGSDGINKRFKPEANEPIEDAPSASTETFSGVSSGSTFDIAVKLESLDVDINDKENQKSISDCVTGTTLVVNEESANRKESSRKPSAKFEVADLCDENCVDGDVHRNVVPGLPSDEVLPSIDLNYSSTIRRLLTRKKTIKKEVDKKDMGGEEHEVKHKKSDLLKRMFTIRNKKCANVASHSQLNRPNEYSEENPFETNRPRSNSSHSGEGQNNALPGHKADSDTTRNNGTENPYTYLDKINPYDTSGLNLKGTPIGSFNESSFMSNYHSRPESPKTLTDRYFGNSGRALSEDLRAVPFDLTFNDNGGNFDGQKKGLSLRHALSKMFHSREHLNSKNFFESLGSKRVGCDDHDKEAHTTNNGKEQEWNPYDELLRENKSRGERERRSDIDAYEKISGDDAGEMYNYDANIEEQRELERRIASYLVDGPSGTLSAGGQQKMWQRQYEGKHERVNSGFSNASSKRERLRLSIFARGEDGDGERIRGPNYNDRFEFECID